MNADAAGAERVDEWPGDVLGRARIAGFLTNTLVGQAAALSGVGGLTVSLDAGWGAGKTFFIRHWAEDLRKAGHPVVVFDAWEHDIGDDAAIALMSAIRSELLAGLDRSDRAVQGIETSLKKAIHGLRKAILPTSKIIASGLLKKFSGIALEEISTVLSDGDAKPSERGALDSSLDKIFESSLDSHRQRREEIDIFKNSIENVITALAETQGKKLPIFVMVDEVDRCRPTYAIRLLEEIKHIFGVKDVCFVVSTNISQLKESVCGVYGAGFDGRSYLNRFFDQTFLLPDGDNANYAAHLLAQDNIFALRKCSSGLPYAQGESQESGVQKAVTLIFTAFGSDLRTQKQALNVARTAASAIPAKNSIFVLWLLFLCVLRQKNQTFFDSLKDSNCDSIKFAEMCSHVMTRDLSISYTTPDREHGRSRTDRAANLSTALFNYYYWAHKDLKELRDVDVNAYDYPSSNLRPIQDEMPTQYYTNTKYPPSIAEYLDLVRYAGLLSKE